MFSDLVLLSLPPKAPLVTILLHVEVTIEGDGDGDGDDEGGDLASGDLCFLMGFYNWSW